MVFFKHDNLSSLAATTTVCATLPVLLITICLQCHRRYYVQAANNINSTIKTVLVFGDSTVDPGNNNYINTIAKANFLPYGIGYKNREPTGRFSDGRLATDFIVSYLGIKEYIPPYLDPSLSLKDMITGVSFASGGSGYDPLTSTANNVISMSKQLDYLVEYRARLEHSVGKKRTAEILKKAVYAMSCGTNDLIESRPLSHLNDLDYQRYLLDLSKNFIQGLVGQGAQKVVVVGLPPVGCLPVVITLNSPFDNPTATRPCVGTLSSIAKDYNRMLQDELQRMQAQARGTGGAPLHLIYADIYDSLDDQIHHPQKYGFSVADRGCCGTGFLEGGITCNPQSLICARRLEYLFWDAIHPSEKAYYYIFEALRPSIDSAVREIYGHGR